MQIATGLFPSATSSVGAAPTTTAGATNADSASASAELGAGDDNVVQEFLKYASMNPFDRMRANILKSMHLTEADLQKMSPDQRSAVEQKIRDAIEKEVNQKKGSQPGSVVDMSA